MPYRNDTKIKCKKCGWSWQRSKGGLDPCKCHKCGYNNNMYSKKITGLGGVSDKKKRATFKKAFGYEYGAKLNEKGKKIRQNTLPLDIAYQVAKYRLKKVKSLGNIN